MPTWPLVPDDLNSEQTFTDVRQQVSDVVSYSSVEDARSLRRQLSQALKAAGDERITLTHEAEYRRMVAELTALLLPTLPEREIVEFGRTLLVAAVANPDLDVSERIRYALADLPSFDERERVKREFLVAMRENDEPFSRVGIPTMDGRPLPGTLRNWLRELHRIVGTVPTTISFAEFFSHSLAAQSLRFSERGTLERLLEIYARLQIPSDALEGFEEEPTVQLPDGSLKLFSDGRLIDVASRSKVRRSAQVFPQRKASVAVPSQPTKPLRAPVLIPTQAPDSVAELTERYKAFASRQASLQPLEAELFRKTRGDLKGLKQELGAAMTGKDRNRAIASLRLLARSGQLLVVLDHEPGAIKTLTDWVAKRYAGKAGLSDAVSALGAAPTSVEAVGEFLQYALRNRLGFSEEDSALVGVDLGQLLAENGHPEASHFAYADATRKTFSWVGHRIEGGRFVREAP